MSMLIRFLPLTVWNLYSKNFMRLYKTNYTPLSIIYDKYHALEHSKVLIIELYTSSFDHKKCFQCLGLRPRYWKHFLWSQGEVYKSIFQQRNLFTLLQQNNIYWSSENGPQCAPFNVSYFFEINIPDTSIETSLL